MRRFLALATALAVSGVLAWQVYLKVSASQQQPVRQRGAVPVAVEIKPVQKSSIRDVRFFTGSLLPKSQFVVAPKIAGRLEKLAVNIGDPVKQGQLIAVLDDAEYLQQVDQARAELDVARANLEESRSSLDISRREFERAKALREKRIASESELDAAEAQLKGQEAKHRVAQAQVAQKAAALKAAQVRLSYTQIQATWETNDGARVVGERFVDEGAMLAPNAAIVSVLDIGSLIGVIHVIERDYSRMKVGQEAIVSTDAFPGKSFEGKVVRVAPLLMETSRQARVEIEIPNEEGMLKPGMFVRVRIELATHDNATVIPVTALVKRNGQQGIFLANVQEMKARFVPVTLGIEHGDVAEVIDPTLSGSVVTLGQHLLEDGSGIILPESRQERSSAKEPGSGGSTRGRGPRPGGRP